MKLHLHLGAHKTATTHFQNVLMDNNDKYPDGYQYIPMEDFRANVTPFIGSRIDQCKPYLNEIQRSSPDVLIVSEENIAGEAKDIFNYHYLYSRLEARLGNLSEAMDKFDDVEIWFSIRSMDEFLPSMYCEYLKYWKFKPFKKVFCGDYEQSWVPVVKAITKCFPHAKINIVQYENYTTTLPIIIDQIFGNNSGWNYQLDTRYRQSFSHIAIESISKIYFILPLVFTSMVLAEMSKYAYRHQSDHKFSPFTEQEKRLLRSIFAKDVKAISGMDNVILY